MDFNTLIFTIAKYSPLLATALRGDWRDWIVSILISKFQSNNNDLVTHIYNDDSAALKIKEIEQLYKNMSNQTPFLRATLVIFPIAGLFISIIFLFVLFNLDGYLLPEGLVLMCILIGSMMYFALLNYLVYVFYFGSPLTQLKNMLLSQ